MGSEETEKQKGSVGRTVARALCSHVGLGIIVIVYCMIGGLLFEMLEKENEILACMESREEYQDMENETLFSLLDVILSNPLDSHASDVQVVGVFESFRNNSFSIGYDGGVCEKYGLADGPMHEWNFAGGIFFSMTVITTIGYGHISPKTVWGRILLLPYSLLGIPIMLMFLANVGDVLANVFRYIYAKVVCCGCFRSKKRHRHQPLQTDATGKTVNLPRSSVSISRTPSNSGRERSTIPDSIGNFKRVSNGSINVAPTNTMMEEPGSKSQALDKTNGHVKQRNSVTGGQQSNIKPLAGADLAQRGRLMRKASLTSKEPLILDEWSDDDDDELEWEEINKIAVPLTVSLGIIGLYIVGGAVLFKYWEDWDMTQASYFCYITLSTIGFGDVTPGRDFSDPMANARLIIGTIYSIFGMAILSMCYTLMQEEMMAKFHWLGRKMGVVDDGDEHEDESNNAHDTPSPVRGRSPTQSERRISADRNQSEC